MGLIAWMVRVIYHVCCLFPRRRKIVFLSRQASRPFDFVLLEPELKRRFPNYTIVWSCVAEIGKMSVLLMVKQIWHVATAELCLVDGYVPAVSLPLRHRSRVIQIWHAPGAIKKFGYQAVGTPAGRSRRAAESLRMHRGYDYVVAGMPGAVLKDAAEELICVKFAEVLRSGMTNAYFASFFCDGVVGGAAVEMGSATPTGLTCDLYGTLYVSYQDGSASAFTEEQFTAGGTGEDTGISVAPGATSLKADFEGNLYYLVGGDLYRNGELFAQADGSAFTYSASEKPRSFALGFEDDAVYFNFGNYIVVSDASTEQAPGPLAGIPTLGEIAESGAREASFSLHEEELLVTVAARSVGIRTDISAFRGGESAYFPYCGYERSSKARAGLLLARTPEDAGGYSLVLFPEEDGSYTAYLYKTSSVTTEEEALRGESGTRWISNDVDACFAPCLESALSADVLPRGQAVTVKGYFTAPDREYALVEYEQSADGAARATVRGWVPASYLSEVSPSLAAGEQYTFAYLKSNEEGVTFTAADGSEQTVTERVQVQLFDNGDGTYTARLAGDPAYSAVVTEEMLDRDNAEVLRISLIIILTVLALVILGAYIFLLPWEKYKKRRK